jgi:hypothetical protein
MRCDCCEGLFEYNEQVVVLYETPEGMRAAYTTEKEGGTVSKDIQPAGKYHVGCYEGRREEQPGQWPALP